MIKGNLLVQIFLLITIMITTRVPHVSGMRPDDPYERNRVVRSFGEALFEEKLTKLVILFMKYPSFDINSCEFNGKTLLQLAAENGWLDGVSFLLQQKQIDINCFKAEMNYPHEGAAMCREDDTCPHVRIMRKFLDDPRIQLANSQALHLAIMYGSATIAHMLIADDRIDVSKPDFFGKTPLSLVINPGIRSYRPLNDKINIIKALLLKGALVKEKDIYDANDSEIKQVLQEAYDNQLYEIV